MIIYRIKIRHFLAKTLRQMHDEHRRGRRTAFELSCDRIELRIAYRRRQFGKPSIAVSKNLFRVCAYIKTTLPIINQCDIRILIFHNDTWVPLCPSFDGFVLQLTHHLIEDRTPFTDCLRVLNMEASTANYVVHLFSLLTRSFHSLVRWRSVSASEAPARYARCPFLQPHCITGTMGRDPASLPTPSPRRTTLCLPGTLASLPRKT